MAPVLAAATMILAVGDGVASASLSVVFDRTTGRPGTLVHVHTGGEGACLSCPNRMPLYFAAATVADRITAPGDPRLTDVGQLLVDDLGNGRATIVVPKVRNGDYILMTYCESCARYSAGRVILSLGPFPRPFEVVGSAVDRPSPTWLRALAGILAAVFAVAAFATARARRSG